MEKEKQNMISRFLQGWGQLFGGSKNAPQPKPFPGDRFFYPEELAYLSKTGEPLTQIEKWAVEAGKKAYIESFGSTARPGFNHVQWQGGIMSSYVKGLPVADNETEQVAKLKELKAQNYILPDKQLDIIRKYEARDILDRHFKTNNGDIYHVEGLETGDKEEPTLSLIKYTPDDISGKKESINFEKFKNDIQTVFHLLSSREEAAFNDRLADAREAKIQYEMIGRTVLDSPIAITEGKIPIEQQKAYGVENGMFIPESWGIIHGGTQIALKGHSDRNEDKTLVIDHMNACNYKELLDVIYDGVYIQRDSKLSAALVKTLGNKLPNGEAFYKMPRSIALFHTDKGVDIDSILVDKQGELFALSSNHHVELSQNDLQKMKNSLVINGIIEQKELEKDLIVPLMKDYVESLTIADDIHSGDIDKLPANTRIKSLCRQEWQLEQAYNQYANHPEDEDFANQYKAEWNAASLIYTLELKRLVDAYRINPGKVDLEKKARFDRLHKLLHFTPKPLRMEQNHSLDASNKVAKEEQRPANDEQLKSKKEVETHIHPAETPAAVAEEKVNIEDTEVSDSEGYGRWHTPDIKQREVYLQYGKLLAEKLALQQTYEKLPLTNNRRSLPTTLDKKEYQGIHAFVLALNTEKNGFFMPVYLTEEDLKSKKLLVKKDASSFPLIEKRGIVNVYNIEQTNYAFRYPQEYASRKNELLSEEQENQKENRLPRLLQPDRWSSAIVQDGKPNLASYNSKEDVIHIGSQDQYDKEDDFYRDLAEGLIRSTRQKEARNTKYNALVKEELISLVGANMLGQENRFNVTVPQQSAIWKKRLRNDPDYARDVLVSASISQALVESRISGIKPQLGNEIDMRSATPINIDSDGNGIVDSQENLVADQKQGSNENQEQQAEDSVSHHVRHGRR
ncbi:ArdC-like ssDNA-binding domain-containing protein [Segatella copri]|uniref:ArdC-like ssDNA-binding domain-containing protein n=1 Tax=Segatella copri TaxID=165179 RepID=UPI001C483CA0|nr:ArdC-like ssDNA-binding domain-containing protein [Segatella copri]MBW0024422.1 DUF1738 domain-containing protein [Segatella copri]WOZ84036.1 ArdC-like ssDNA-binding domain-containing protein [Segatella copri]